MLVSWQELKKIIDQIRGTQNVFGYKSTIANQMYLFYCFCGNMYFTDKMDAGVKHLWYILIFMEVAITYSLTTVYFIYDKEYNLVMMLYISGLAGVCTIESFGFPLMSYICADRIEAMIKLADRILTQDGDDRLVNSKQCRIFADLKSTFLRFLFLFLICSVTALSICTFDVVLFFSEDKVKNVFYHTAFIPWIVQHGTFGSFISLNVISFFVLEMYTLQFIWFFAVLFYWNMVCCNELRDIQVEFDNRSRYLMEVMKKCLEVRTGFKEWNRKFHAMVRCGIGRIQDTILLMNYLRMFLEVIGSFVAVAAFSFSIAVLYLCLSEDLPFVLVIKYVAGTLMPTLTTFAFYWCGQNFENSMIHVSTAVYSTPWHYSVQERKNIHILLCQTQTVKNFTIIKVYGLLFKNFARFSNGVMSYTNLLRKTIRK